MLDRTNGGEYVGNVTPSAEPIGTRHSPTARALSATWGGQPLTATRGRAVLLLAGTMILLSAALLVHAAAQRYQVTHLAGLYVTRTDRLTGRVELCRGSRSGQMVCQAAERP